MDFYQSDPSKLSDQEITRLMEEIEESGVLANDRYEYDDEGCWEFQAIQRWESLLEIKRQRRPGEMSSLPLAALAEYTREFVFPRAAGDIFEDSLLFKRLTTRY